VLLTGFTRAETIASLVVVVLMVRAGVGLVRDAGRIFLEAAPSGVDPDESGRHAGGAAVAGHRGARPARLADHLRPDALSAHVLVESGTDCTACAATRTPARRGLRITHTTLQVDHAPHRPSPPRPTRNCCRWPTPTAADTHGPVHREGPHAH